MIDMSLSALSLELLMNATWDFSAFMIRWQHPPYYSTKYDHERSSIAGNEAVASARSK